jgi:hypothetical protein
MLEEKTGQVIMAFLGSLAASFASFLPSPRRFLVSERCQTTYVVRAYYPNTVSGSSGWPDTKTATTRHITTRRVKVRSRWLDKWWAPLPPLSGYHHNKMHNHTKSIYLHLHWHTNGGESKPKAIITGHTRRSAKPSSLLRPLQLPLPPPPHTHNQRAVCRGWESLLVLKLIMVTACGTNVHHCTWTPHHHIKSMTFDS